MYVAIFPHFQTVTGPWFLREAERRDRTCMQTKDGNKAANKLKMQSASTMEY